jgi:hypothetical protein
MLAADNFYWESSYEQPESSPYPLKEIPVTNLHYPNSTMIDSGTKQYTGYNMGKFTVDFNAGTFKDFFKDKDKEIISRQEGSYFYNNSNYYNSSSRIYISDTRGNHSTVSCFVHILKYDETNLKDNIWYNMTTSYYFNYYTTSFFQNIKTDKIVFDYFFIIDDIGELKPNDTWILYVPNKKGSYEFPTLNFRIDKGWTLRNKYYEIDNNDYLNNLANYYINNETSIDNEIYGPSGFLLLDNAVGLSDIYSLNVEIQKKFDETSDDFFDGQMHDYYSLDFDSYKYNELTEDPFSLCLEITSAHGWNLYLDNKDDPTKEEIIKYTLYLKYKNNNNYSTLKIKNKQDKILIKNIESSNTSSIIYLVTKCDSAKPDKNIKGTYQDTVYINFITDGWDNGAESNFAEKTITLSN